VEVVSSTIEVRGLVKDFGTARALDGLDLDVAPGEVHGFLGPNGAGKSTTIKILCTLARPTSGTARVAGHDVTTERDRVRRNIGLVFQDTTLDNYLTGAQNLRFHAELYGVPAAAVAPRMQQVMEMVGLWDRRDSLVMTYSGGMQRRLEIARGLLHAPRVLFLDEPTVGLDPQTRTSIWEYINELKAREDITIFLTTHYMDEAEQLADRLVVMDKGVIVAEGSPRELIERYSTREVAEIRFGVGQNEAAAPRVSDLADRVEVLPDRLLLYTEDGEHALQELLGRGLRPETTLVRRATLEDVFLRLTGRTLAD